MHKAKYINYICRLYDFPALDSKKIDDILKDDNANKKYIKHVDEYWLDEEVDNATKESITLNDI
jgi:hypothetical protein